MKNKKFWNWATRNQEDGMEMRTLTLNGVIASESWFDDDVTPQMFKDELLAGSGDIEVFINSPGGDRIAASQIYTMLNEYKGNVTIKIDGLAASAASVIAMAGNTTLMAPTAIMMIHNPFTIAEGNVDDFEKAIAMLNEVKESIINAYEMKSGLSRAKISHLMDSETWLNAGKALDLGFIDGIIGSEKHTSDEKSKNLNKSSFSFSEKEITASLISKVSKAHQTSKDIGGVVADDLLKRLNLLSH